MTRLLTRIRRTVNRMTFLDKALMMVTAIVTISAVAFLALTLSSRAGLLIVKTGSMTPRMPAGSLLVFKAADIQDIQTGQIIVFKDGQGSSAIISHRVIGRVIDKGKVHLKTKGDSNHKADTTLVSDDEIMGKAVSIMPYAGHILAFTKTALGMFILNFLLAFFVLLIALEKVRANERLRIACGSVEGELVNPRGVKAADALELS